MPAKPHVVIFDVEGTLVDCIPQTITCWQQVLHSRGFDISIEALQRCSGMDTTLMLRQLLPPTAHASIDEIIKEQGGCYRDVFLPTVEAFKGAFTVFSALATKGHRLGLAATCRKDELSVYLKLLDIAQFVEAIVCGDDVRHHKPAPDMIELAAARLEADAAGATWSVGDTPFDAMAALAAGVNPIGTVSGGFT